MALPNLNGYWKYEDKVVGFRFPFYPARQVAHAFLPREPQHSSVPSMPLSKPGVSSPTRPTTSTGKSPKAPRHTPSMEVNTAAAAPPRMTPPAGTGSASATADGSAKRVVQSQPTEATPHGETPLPQSPQTPGNEIQDTF